MLPYATYIVDFDDFIVVMGRFEKYNVDLKGLKTSSLNLEFDLDNAFFGDIDGEEFQKGAVMAVVTVKRSRDVFDFSFDLKGKVVAISRDIEIADDCVWKPVVQKIVLSGGEYTAKIGFNP